jgi:acetylornithine aminotransferase
MDLLQVYKLWDIEPVKAKDTTIWDNKGEVYTDLYGGHAVISVGHGHPVYVQALKDQLDKIGFYSNAVQNSLQKELAKKLGEVSGYEDFNLFLCNSGAEANENALKLASFTTGRKKVLAFKKAFHGRTSGAVAATDNPKIQAEFNKTDNITFVPLNDIDAVEEQLKSENYAAVIIEGIQGVAGIFEPTACFMGKLRELCTKYGTLLILDEIQSGYGRTGKFFAHQHYGITPDIITTAKGMGNGFPIGGVLSSPAVPADFGMLGTTFGGNHLACAAAIAVLDIIKNENLVENAAKIGEYFEEAFKNDPAIKEYRGKGLMIGLELNDDYVGLRDKLLFEKHYFTGAAGAKVIRLLPSLTVSQETAEGFVSAWKSLTK